MAHLRLPLAILLLVLGVGVLVGRTLEALGYVALPYPISHTAERSPSPPPKAPPADVAALVRLEEVATLEQPLGMAIPKGDARRRIFLAEKGGKVRILEGGKVLPAPFIDLSARVSRGSEQGLLGIALHPRFLENRRVYLDFTDKKGDTRIIEVEASKESPDRADPSSEREIFFLKQPWANHNGGHILFGPDGKLWVGTGDGGAGGDPLGSGQDPKSLLGKMLRLDVDAKRGEDGRAPLEVRMLGLRNPWRYAFDAASGDLFIADVGQNKWEEVSVVPRAAEGAGGWNLGWNVIEGMGHRFGRKGAPAPANLVDPVVEYGRQEGISITGGVVYRGKALPELAGSYFYADYASSILRSFRFVDGAVKDHWEWRPVLDPKRAILSSIAGFGEDHEGEMWILSLEGPVWRLARSGALR